MKFLQKRWVAVLLCIAMIATAIGFGIYRDRKTAYQPDIQTSAQSSLLNPGTGNYSNYTRYVDDEASALKESTIQEISTYNAQLDQTYGSICGLVILDTAGNEELEDLAIDLSEQLELGNQDALLLLVTDTEEWYFAYGEGLTDYADEIGRAHV